MKVVAWTQGEPYLTTHGGTMDPSPTLSNGALFARDRYHWLNRGRHCTRGEPHYQAMLAAEAERQAVKKP